ncbi:MAG: amidohydrolase family protein [Saprospiraceae bacterium]|nr:amidohydrolase family protein [Saprospiraceae bacterium]
MNERLLVSSFFLKLPLCLALALLVPMFSPQAQPTFPVNGIRHPETGSFLLMNAEIHLDSATVLPRGQLLIHNGIIVAVGPSVSVGDTAIRIDMEGRFIYPAFVDPVSHFGMPEKTPSPGKPEYESMRPGSYGWNDALRCEQSATSVLRYSDESAARYRKAGYAYVQTHVPDGISRGSACVVMLYPANENELVLNAASSHVLHFDKGSSSQFYPSSLMGSIALLRQTFLDGIQYDQAIRPHEHNLSLEHWRNLQSLPQLFIAGSPFNLLRASSLFKEFGIRGMLVGDGREYQRADAIRRTGQRIIVPLDFPEPYDVEDPLDALNIDLSDLKHWELAPSNPAILANHGIPFVFTSLGLPDPSQILTNVRKAIRRGLSPGLALYALTAGPATWLNVDRHTGTLHPGKTASLIVADGPLFSDKSRILETWVRGRRFPVQQRSLLPVATGRFAFEMDTLRVHVAFDGDANKTELRLPDADSSRYFLHAKGTGHWVSGQLGRTGPTGNFILFSAWKGTGSLWTGRAQREDGSWTNLVLRPEGQDPPDSTRAKSTSAPADTGFLGPVTRPFSAYGWSQTPVPEHCVIRNATVWTNEKEGILPQTDVIISQGKIRAVGKKLSAPGAREIDGTGKHLTAGIIDEHSHIAVNGGVNECSHANTAEVRIGDVINPEDINIYRQLSGGVTTAQLLHGSCNPIGGQSALIKLRWGLSADSMKFEGADPFIKFALGENVKRSGGNQSNRFPDTRMGVEQVYEDAFTRARQYDVARRENPQSTRRDLQLEALAEILRKRRFVTCHSYVQSEINMLMHLAQRFGFRINTFTHILEGYKLADRMREHGAGASAFADWWAYKYEVYEATPYNGALLHDQGIVTAYNSDDAEMARRLNQEAAKAVLYGGVSEEEALKFVTLNPARLLHIDHRVGSIRTGKDADVVLWSDHPLSVRAKAELTFVDGVLYFDRKTDLSLRENVERERSRILQNMLRAKASGEKAQKFKPRRKRLYHCDSIGGDDAKEEEETDH